MATDRQNDLRRVTPGDDLNRDVPLDVEQADPELAEGRAGGGRLAVYAVAIVVLLGAVFYGLNSTWTTSTATNPSAPSTTADSRPPAPPVVRDVTPNRDSSTTTGAAPAQPTQPPQSNPTGSEVDRSKGPAN